MSEWEPMAESEDGFPMRGPRAAAAYKALKEWAETDRGKRAVAEVGGVWRSGPLADAFLAAWGLATAPTESRR